MNNRTRQWFKANAMLDKHDPPMLARVGNKCLIFRKSSLEKYQEQYKDELKVIWDGSYNNGETASASGRGDT